jgi:hypothetical protein
MVCNSLGPRYLAIAAISAFVGSSLFAQERQTAAVSHPSTQETNSSKSFGSHGLKDLEQSIFRPFRSPEPETSLDGVLDRAQRPAPVPSKRAKEMMERRKDWAFMTPEEIITGKSADDPLNPKGSGKDDDESKSLSPMDRYFQRLYGQDRKAKTDTQGARKDPFGSSAPGVGQDDSDDPESSTAGLPESVRETQRNLKKNADGKKDLQTRRSSSGFFSDVFALERKKSTPEEERVERDRMEAYRKSLGLDPTPTFGASFSPLFADPKDPYRIAVPPALMNSSPSPSPHPDAASHVALPNANPFLDSPSKGVAPSSLTPSLPKTEPPKSYIPPQPNFAAPRRAF